MEKQQPTGQAAGRNSLPSRPLEKIMRALRGPYCLMVLVVALLMWVPVGVSAGDNPDLCKVARGAEVIEQSTQVRVSGRPWGRDHLDVVACRRDTGRKDAVAAGSEELAVSQVRVARSRVAYAVESQPAEYNGILFWDLYVHTTRPDASTTKHVTPAAGPVSDIVLRASGSVAFVVFETEDKKRAVVAKCEARGCLDQTFPRPKRLDFVRATNANSLVLRGSRLTWLDRAQRRASTLR